MFPHHKATSLFLGAMVLLTPLLLARKTSSLQRADEGTAPTVAAPPSAPAVPHPCPRSVDDDPPGLADFMNNNRTMAKASTNEFTWKVLAFISRPAAKQRPIPRADHTVVMSNDEEWETWADDSALFPQPVADSNYPPCWNDRSRQFDGVKLTSGRSKTSITPQGVAVTASILPPRRADLAAPAPAGPCSGLGDMCNEVRHNRQDFESIVKNGLWNMSGLARAAALKRTRNPYIPDGQIIDHASIEIKAEWKRIPCTTDCETQKLAYHWNYDKDGNLYGLVALHLITRALDNWTWATFEWEQNPRRCDYYGCHDVWGGEDIPARRKPTDQPYPVAKLSDNVTGLNWQGNARTEWSHYRLKGTQTDFFGKDGKPAILGNSILESRIIGKHASCITCHAEASVTSNGNQSNSLGIFEPSIAQARITGAKQDATIGKPHLAPESHPIGFIWSTIRASCDISDTVHPCPSVKQ